MSKWLARALTSCAILPPCDDSDESDETPSYVANVAIVARGGDRESPPFQVSRPGLTSGWEQAFASLDRSIAPCPLFRDWPGTCRVVDDFLSRHADEAARLGWTAPELFGVHRLVGTIRLDCSGALMVSGGRPVTELDATTIRFSGGLAFRRSEIPAGLVVPVWEFGK